MSLYLENFPKKIKDIDNWQLCLVWPNPSKPGKWEKLPFKPKFSPKLELYNAGGFTWEHCFQVKKWLENKKFNWKPKQQILYGFHLKNSGHAILDFDHCFPLNPELLEILNAFASFTEKSISGGGLHTWIKLDLGELLPPNTKFPDRGIEIYTNQFVAVTGEPFPGMPTGVGDYSDIFLDYFKIEPKKQQQGLSKERIALIESVTGCTMAELLPARGLSVEGQLRYLEGLLNNRGISLNYSEKKNVWYLSNCLFEQNHSFGITGRTDSYFWVNPEGYLSFSCSHSHCQGKGIADVRKTFNLRGNDE